MKINSRKENITLSVILFLRCNILQYCDACLLAGASVMSHRAIFVHRRKQALQREIMILRAN